MRVARREELRQQLHAGRWAVAVLRRDRQILNCAYFSGNAKVGIKEIHAALFGEGGEVVLVGIGPDVTLGKEQRDVVVRHVANAVREPGAIAAVEVLGAGDAGRSADGQVLQAPRVLLPRP